LCKNICVARNKKENDDVKVVFNHIKILKCKGIYNISNMMPKASLCLKREAFKNMMIS
jgi:hypothetical protein